SQCAVCHGSNGTGGIGPALKGTQLDARTMVKITGRGIAGSAMSPWSNEEGGTLAKYQVEDVVNFVLNWDDNLLAGGEAAHGSPPASAHTPAPAGTPPPASTPAPKPSEKPPVGSTPVPVPQQTPASTPSPATPPLPDGRPLYTKNCAACHGPNRQGVPNFAPAVTSAALAKLSDVAVGDKILGGVPGTAMPPFRGKLSPIEVEGLVRFLKDATP
ncbi:MAG: cytochrome c, partial [Dehalococcoidia bacterium]|nr:cytochrome c [Dehalococcoidia bacterium]